MGVSVQTPHIPYQVGDLTLNITENPDYMHVYNFEKLDFAWFHRLSVENLHVYLATSVFYLISVFVLKKWMANREALQLRKPLFAWSTGLAILSVVMFLRTLPELVYINKTYGFYASYCKQINSNSATAFWAVVYTYSKIVEFGDTWFIILRKQRLTFLHTFHHFSVFLACILGILTLDPAAKYFMVMNSFVHAVMYTYFALKAAQVKIPRKISMAITSVQLLQFITAIGINFFSAYATLMKTEPRCERANHVHLLHFVLGLVYFYLFAQFFVESYLTKKKVHKGKAE